MTLKHIVPGFALLALLAAPSQADPYLMEELNRGIVAVRASTTTAYVSWRLLGTEPLDLGFNLYRSTGGGAPVKLNENPIVDTTDFTDATANFTQSNTYFVRLLDSGSEVAGSDSESFTIPAGAPVQQYLSIPVQAPPGGTVLTPGTGSFTYSANDSSVADLDGDGQLDIVVKWEPSNTRDTASTGYSGPQILDGYRVHQNANGTLTSTRLWRINLGWNIRSGPHYTQFMVYDLDGDGRAELVCKTADGTIDGLGNVIGTPNVDHRSHATGTVGRVLDGPEYLTVFDGLTGAALATTNYIPGRDPINGWGGIGGNGNNDSVGNRVDRFLACVAYLDGLRPSVVMCRGYYGRSVLAAWDWRDGQLTQRWVFDSVDGTNPYSGQGGHHVGVADVDFDGKQEIIYHSAIIDDDGTGYLTFRVAGATSGIERGGLRHGDAMHFGDLDPTSPGIEVFGIHENEGNTTTFQTPGIATYNATTKTIVWSANPGQDTGRGVASDIDPTSPGAETWGGNGGTRRITDGVSLYSQVPNSQNMAVWWDADLLREQEDGTSIRKWNWETRTTVTLLNATGTTANNGSKSNPCIIADFIGDWREEVIWRNTNSTELRIYTTTIPASRRIHTMLHDGQYRVALAWQNVGYNQPPWPSFWIGENPETPPSMPYHIVTEEDTTPPELTLPNNMVLEATSPAGAVATFSGSAHDAVSGDLPVLFDPPSGDVFPIGVTTVTGSATDEWNNTATGTFTITVVDTTAPDFQSLSASPNVLGRNHEMVPITLTALATDIADPELTFQIISVTSNEPINGPGDGNTSPDWEITGPLTLNLRAERAGGGNGRIYTIVVEVSDDSGNTAQKTVTVVVPHDNGN